MQLHISTSLHKVPSTSLYPYSPKCWLYNSTLFRGIKFPRRKLSPNSRFLRIAFCSGKVSSPNGNPFLENREESASSWEDSRFVEVIGIGSRKDAVLDFCLDSPLLGSSLRFWEVLIEDSVKVQLQQRFSQKDVGSRVVGGPSVLQSCHKAVILVATAAYGSDHIRLVDFLKSVESANGLVVGIILKPFSFEGRRRRDELNDLVEKLQEHTSFCIVVDPDVLLEKDLVTLDEALRTANTAVLMAINAISVLISENQKKLLYSTQRNMSELKWSELMKILESYKEAKIGFGAGYNINTSIMRAIYDCPFLSVDLKNLDGVVICILASSAVIDGSDVKGILHSFRQSTECPDGFIMSLVHDSNLESNLILATVIILGGNIKHQASQESGIFSRLAQHFPFIFNLLRRGHPQSHDSQERYFPENPSSYMGTNSAEKCEMPHIIPEDVTAEAFGMFSAELHTLLSSNADETYSLSSEEKEVEILETESFNSWEPKTEGEPAFQRELLIRRNLGPGDRMLEEWTNKEVNDNEAPRVLQNLSTYKIPVGVKPCEEFNNNFNISNTSHHQKKVAEDSVKAQTQFNPRMSWDASLGAGFEAVSEFYDSASASLKGNYSDVSKKHGVLSVRAASMLEAERTSQKKWNPTVEMKYRGGTYKGHCQGGLPEGKGRLCLWDGSIYDGIWRYGKRSGLGTFYFSNGDVFQGSWRDDVMHGKGWLYFHTGDRWFVNFWKGKANGEGRFYSKLGEIFFGYFKNGWRHGHFLCINVDGARFAFKFTCCFSSFMLFFWSDLYSWVHHVVLIVPCKAYSKCRQKLGLALLLVLVMLVAQVGIHMLLNFL